MSTPTPVIAAHLGDRASDILPDVEISPSRSNMFSEVHKQRPSADDFFCDTPQCSNQSHVSLISFSDLGTHVKG